MDPSLFLRGLVIGLSIAAPVGPIGVLVIRRTLAQGRLIGFVSGGGAATADALYGAVAASGLTAVSALLVHYRTWVQTVGGIFLLYLGLKTLTARSPQDVTRSGATELVGAYCSTLALTLTNPATILSFIAIFAGLGLVDARGELASAVTLVFGVFLGSLTWWFLLSAGIGMFRSRVGLSALRSINLVSGAIITLFGVAAVGTALRVL